MRTKNRPLRLGQIQFTSCASPQGVGLHPYTLGWFTSTPSTGALHKPGWQKSCGQWGVMKKTVSKPRHPPTNTALRQHCTLLLGAALLPLSGSQHDPWPYSHPDRRSFWQSYLLNSFCLHEHWSMKHAIRSSEMRCWDSQYQHTSNPTWALITLQLLACIVWNVPQTFFYSKLSCLLYP